MLTVRLPTIYNELHIYFAIPVSFSHHTQDIHQIQMQILFNIEEIYIK